MHHFVTEIRTCVHISVTKWCIMGCLSIELWDLWDGSITKTNAYYQLNFQEQCVTKVNELNLFNSEFFREINFNTLCVYILHTVETLYSTIYYSKYFIELNIDKSTQYVALWTLSCRASYGVSFMSTSTEIDRVIKGFYCKSKNWCNLFTII